MKGSGNNAGDIVLFSRCSCTYRLRSSVTCISCWKRTNFFKIICSSSCACNSITELWIKGFAIIFILYRRYSCEWYNYYDALKFNGDGRFFHATTLPTLFKAIAHLDCGKSRIICYFNTDRRRHVVNCKGTTRHTIQYDAAPHSVGSHRITRLT